MQCGVPMLRSHTEQLWKPYTGNSAAIHRLDARGDL
jgi:hypothetical protein